MTMSVREACPECGSQLFKKNGHIHNGKQNHQGKDCSRQFVLTAMVVFGMQFPVAPPPCGRADNGTGENGSPGGSR